MNQYDHEKYQGTKGEKSSMNSDSDEATYCEGLDWTDDSSDSSLDDDSCETPGPFDQPEWKSHRLFYLNLVLLSFVSFTFLCLAIFGCDFFFFEFGATNVHVGLLGRLEDGVCVRTINLYGDSHFFLGQVSGILALIFISLSILVLVPTVLESPKNFRKREVKNTAWEIIRTGFLLSLVSSVLTFCVFGSDTCSHEFDCSMGTGDACSYDFDCSMGTSSIFVMASCVVTFGLTIMSFLVKLPDSVQTKVRHISRRATIDGNGNIEYKDQLKSGPGTIEVVETVSLLIFSFADGHSITTKKTVLRTEDGQVIGGSGGKSSNRAPLLTDERL